MMGEEPTPNANLHPSYGPEYIKAVLLDPRVLITHPIPSEWLLSEVDRTAHQILRDLAQGDGVDPMAFWSAWIAAGKPVAAYAERLDRAIGDCEIATEGLRRTAERMELQRILRDAYQQAQDPLEPVADVVARVLAGLARVGGDAGTGDISTVLRETLDRLAEIETKGGVSGIETDFILLDRLIGGWEKDKLYFVGARPKAGKTAFAMQSAVAACEQGAAVYFASREMGAVQFGTRLLSQVGQVDGNALRRAALSREYQGKIAQAVARLSKYGRRFVVDTRATLPWERLRASVLQAHARERLGLVVIDYVQLLRSEGRADNRAEDLEKIAYGLKDLAKELRAPVLTLSQLNRDQDETKAPSSSRMKGSGGIEQAADVSILLWRPNAKDLRTIEFVVDLNRDGPTGSFRTQFRPEWTLFE